MSKTVALHNLGCKVNAYELEAMQQLLEAEGYEIVPFAPGADIYIINTCTVTNIADRKSRQMLHRAKKMNPDALVVAAGCYVQAQGKKIEKDTSIDLVIGNNKKQDLIRILREYEESRMPAEAEQKALCGNAGTDAPAGAGKQAAAGEHAETAAAKAEENGKGGAAGTAPEKNAQNAKDRTGGAEELAAARTNAENGIRKEEFSGKLHMIDINHTGEYETLSISRTAEHTRAYIKVQDGCNQFCSYCIIPYARGRVRSRAKEDVLREAGRLAAGGCREVVLTGIHLSSYGADFPGEAGEDLLSLIEAVHRVDGIRRIRLGSLEPRIVTGEFARALADMPKVCPHFHLSLQSGCDAVLRRMNRRYSAAEYRECCRILRRYFGDPALTTDIIVGFPQETEEEFAECLSFVEQIGFYETHIFKYSRREGTKAAAMSGQLTEQVKHARSQALLELDARRRREFAERRLGQPQQVLLEEKTAVSGEEYWTGYTREYVRVGVRASEELQNRMVTAVPELLYKNELLLANDWRAD